MKRRDITTALFNLLVKATAFRTTGKRVKLWKDVPQSERPAMFLMGHGERYEHDPAGLAAPAKRILNYECFVYLDLADPNLNGIDATDDLMDSFEALLAPDNALVNANTLGGLVTRCWIEGDVVKDPGDLDGDGMVIIPIRVLVP